MRRFVAELLTVVLLAGFLLSSLVPVAEAAETVTFGTSAAREYLENMNSYRPIIIRPTANVLLTSVNVTVSQSGGQYVAESGTSTFQAVLWTLWDTDEDGSVDAGEKFEKAAGGAAPDVIVNMHPWSAALVFDFAGMPLTGGLVYLVTVHMTADSRGFPESAWGLQYGDNVSTSSSVLCSDVGVALAVSGEMLVCSMSNQSQFTPNVGLVVSEAGPVYENAYEVEWEYRCNPNFWGRLTGSGRYKHELRVNAYLADGRELAGHWVVSQGSTELAERRTVWYLTNGFLNAIGAATGGTWMSWYTDTFPMDPAWVMLSFIPDGEYPPLSLKLDLSQMDGTGYGHWVGNLTSVPSGDPSTPYAPGDGSTGNPSGMPGGDDTELSALQRVIQILGDIADSFRAALTLIPAIVALIVAVATMFLRGVAYVAMLPMLQADTTAVPANAAAAIQWFQGMHIAENITIGGVFSAALAAVAVFTVMKALRR